MTQEEKAKAYNEALARANELYNRGYTSIPVDIFPELKEENEESFEIPFGAYDSELVEETYFIPEGMEAVIEGDKVIIRRKESEDERIRKNCIHFLELQKEHHASTIEIDKCIAWLEKQKKLEKETTIAWHDVSEEPQEMRELFCEWESDDATWHDVCFYDSKTNKFRQNKMPIDNVTKWTYVDELLELQKTVSGARKMKYIDSGFLNAWQMERERFQNIQNNINHYLIGSNPSNKE